MSRPDRQQRDDHARQPADRLSEHSIGDFLIRLASRTPAPGGGSCAALHAAQAAALLAMVARYSTGDRYAEHARRIEKILGQADTARVVCLDIAAADAAAFELVARAYRLPKRTDNEQRTRRRAIARALTSASSPPMDVIEQASALVSLAERLIPIANRSVITDVAAASEAARAAATTARLNIEVNLRGVTDDDARAQLATALNRVDDIVDLAASIDDTVRKLIRE